MYCLDELSEQLKQNHSTSQLEILIFEPCPAIGAGAVYDPRQPNFLRMNFAAQHIDAWRRSQRPAEQGHNLVDWLKLQGYEGFGAESYVPRALVGEYLKYCMSTVRQSLARVAKVKIENARIRRIDSEDSRWLLLSENSKWLADEVLLTVGHEGWRSPALSATQRQASAINVFPINGLTEEKFPPAQSTVAIRGFGLTAIDGILALTEGRGGKFRRSQNRLEYVPSGREPKRILPFSRTGRPMLAKPIKSLMQVPDSLDALWSEVRSELKRLPLPLGPDSVIGSLWRLVTSTAAKAHRITNPSSPQPKTGSNCVENWFKQWCQEFPLGPSVTEVLIQSVGVAKGELAADIPWALGEAWRQLYPALVNVVNHGGVTAEAWEKFTPIVTEMERVAFGPPAENIERLLALIEGKYLDLSYLQSSLIIENESSLILQNSQGKIPVDSLINAVLPSPSEFDTKGPIADLVSNNRIQRLHGQLGIEVDPSGTPVSNASCVSTGLSILGRSTEGCILGNDTLSRELNSHPQRWAHAVVQRLLLSEQSTVYA